MTDGTTPPGLAPLFEQIQIGPLRLRNRIMLPPHGRVVANPFGSPSDVDRHAAYWRSRAQSGVAWICGLTGFVGNVLIPGFEPSGVGATARGDFRGSGFRDGARRYVDAVHDGGAMASVQLVMQGGKPHSPSGHLANPVDLRRPHVLDGSEIERFVDEYAFSAAEAAAAGADGIELHANHEDLLQLFLSPATNLREDEWGGDLDGRTRFVRRILDAVRATVGPSVAVGIRLNMEERVAGGYDLDGGVQIARRLVETGTVDYVHGVIGNNWGSPSYIAPPHHGTAPWAPLAHVLREALPVPVVYSGRVTTLDVAAGIVSSGQADVVGMARAFFADGELLVKARQGRTADIRPCIGTNDCLHRVVVDGVRFGCSVNPRAGRELEPAQPPADPVRRVLVVGGGPAGMEVAAGAAERGHHVSLWEREDALGGQVRIAARAPGRAVFADWIAHQARRLESAGVDVVLGRQASIDDIHRARPDVVVVATGATSACPDVPGVHLPHVLDLRDVLLERVTVGARVAVIAGEDHAQPLAVAEFLAARGHDVLLLYPGHAVAPRVGPYSIGTSLAALGAAGVRIEVMQSLVAVMRDGVETANTFAPQVRRTHGPLDSVVLAYGGEARSELHLALMGSGLESHLVGDAFAPRRISWATRQAYELAGML